MCSEIIVMVWNLFSFVISILREEEDDEEEKKCDWIETWTDVTDIREHTLF